MFDALILAANTEATEPPPIQLSEAQRMAIISTIVQLRKELDEAEARALFWYEKAKKECSPKTKI